MNCLIELMFSNGKRFYAVRNESLENYLARLKMAGNDSDSLLMTEIKRGVPFHARVLASFHTQKQAVALARVMEACADACDLSLNAVAPYETSRRKVA